MIRAHQPGSEPIDIPEAIPNPVVVPEPTPAPAPIEPTRKEPIRVPDSAVNDILSPRRQNQRSRR